MLFNPGSVGSQSLLGLPMIHRLAASTRRGAVWPFDDPPQAAVVLAEVYPSLLAGPVAIEANRHQPDPPIRHRSGCLSRALWRLAQGGRLAPLLDAPPEAAEEGWILGANEPALLAQALHGKHPPRPADHHRTAAAALYWEAFGGKLGAVWAPRPRRWPFLNTP